jgi:DNA-binding winged helix-turn-helix (wHTH) protein
MSRCEVLAAAQFGRFLLDSHRRELLADGMPVRIGSRAFDVLIVLVDARGQLVTKRELLDRVWPGTIVEENTLQFQISTVRKALGPDRDFIKTISGRGYRFIADISTPADPAAASVARRHDSALTTTLPALTLDHFGREAILADLADLVATHRLAVLLGAGGIQKTRLGMEVGRRWLSDAADGV